MKILKERILKDGIVKEGNVLKVEDKWKRKYDIQKPIGFSKSRKQVQIPSVV